MGFYNHISDFSNSRPAVRAGSGDNLSPLLSVNQVGFSVWGGSPQKACWPGTSETHQLMPAMSEAAALASPTLAASTRGLSSFKASRGPGFKPWPRRFPEVCVKERARQLLLLQTQPFAANRWGLRTITLSEADHERQISWLSYTMGYGTWYQWPYLQTEVNSPKNLYYSYQMEKEGVYFGVA